MNSHTWKEHAAGKCIRRCKLRISERRGELIDERLLHGLILNSKPGHLPIRRQCGIHGHCGLSCLQDLTPLPGICLVSGERLGSYGHKGVIFLVDNPISSRFILRALAASITPKASSRSKICLTTITCENNVWQRSRSGTGLADGVCAAATVFSCCSLWGRHDWPPHKRAVANLSETGDYRRDV